MTRPLISVVLPVYNERETLEPLVQRLLPVLSRVAGESYEVVFVDDGSTDDSGDLLDLLHTRNPRLKVLHLSRNFGHQAALQAGLSASSGDAVVLMDADLQDPPEVLERFVEGWKQGYQVVYAVRRQRKEHVVKRLAYAAFYRTMKRIAEIDVPLDAGDFCLLDRRVAHTLSAFRERNRFLRGLRSWVGFRQLAIPYERAPRYSGTPKFTLRKLIGLALAGYVGFSALPLRLAAWLGVLAAGSGFFMALWVVVSKLAGNTSPQGWTSTVAVILLVGGTQLLMLGVIGEYLGRVYDEVRQRPLYLIRSRVGFGDESGDGAAAQASSLTSRTADT